MNNELLAKVCTEFGVNAQWLLLGEGEMHGGEAGRSAAEAQPPKVVYIDPAVQLVDEALAETGIEINQRQKQAIIDIVREEMKTNAVEIIKALKGKRDQK